MYCLFCVVLCIVFVHMCTVLLPPGGYPLAVKYIIRMLLKEILNTHYFIFLYTAVSHTASFPAMFFISN